MTTFEVEKAKVKVGIGLMVSFILGFASVCITIGVVFGDWSQWRKSTTKDVNELQMSVFPGRATATTKTR